MAYARNKDCSPFFFLFEDTAFVSEEGHLNWIGKFHYWPGLYTKFIAYWPANANVELDILGNLIRADCTLLAISEPYCQFSENPTLNFHPLQEESSYTLSPIGFEVPKINYWKSEL